MSVKGFRETCAKAALTDLFSYLHRPLLQTVVSVDDGRFPKLPERALRSIFPISKQKSLFPINT